MPDSTCMSIYELARENVKLQEEIDHLREQMSGETSTNDRAATTLRSVIKDHSTVQDWPHLPGSLTSSAMQVPHLYRRFFLCLLTGDSDPKCISDRVQWLLESFAQDFIYAVTCRRQKPPKHILLGTFVKSLPGNVEIMKALNRIASVSYSQVEENETALCLLKLAENDGNAIVPENVFSHLFTTIF